ncbi:hypothetical protein [Embleya sp. NPDC020630]|uniref:hypothetical protein n=1 Tax=Embleya sp. NPDC020630 TaxID=3363979 RepID=UPI0037B3E849
MIVEFVTTAHHDADDTAGVLRSDPQLRRDPDARWICLPCAEPPRWSDLPFTDRDVAEYRHIPRACQSCARPFPTTVEEPATTPTTADSPR